MDLDQWVKVFDRLLPRSRAWSLIIDRTLKKFFHGLSILPQMVEEQIASVLLEAFPDTTTYLSDWSLFFGSPTTLDSDELETEWGAFGGQSPQYIQSILLTAGFNTLFVHEWWVPDSNPPVARNPFSPVNLIDSSYVLVNDLTEVDKNYTYQFGDGSQLEPTPGPQFGEYDGYYLRMKKYPCPNIASEYPVYWYVCDETWPNYALVEQSKFRTLIRLLYKIKPVHTRIILRVTLVPDGVLDGDIQDTTWETDQWQDVTTGPDDVQDKF